MKRFLLLVAVAAAMLSFAGCSQKEVQSAWCVYHASRLVHDIRTHQRGWAALQGALVVHHCRRAF